MVIECHACGKAIDKRVFIILTKKERSIYCWECGEKIHRRIAFDGVSPCLVTEGGDRSEE